MGREFEGKKLLLFGGVKTACSVVEMAQAMGAYVAVLDYNIDSPAKVIADEAVLLDATDVDAIVEYCQQNGIDGVTTGFIDILIKKDKIVDKPILSFYMVADDLEKTKDTLSYMNEKIQVVNSEGESLLSAKFNPANL